MNIIIDILIGGMSGALVFIFLCCCKVGGDADRYTEDHSDDD